MTRTNPGLEKGDGGNFLNDSDRGRLLEVGTEEEFPTENAEKGDEKRDGGNFSNDSDRGRLLYLGTAGEFRAGWKRGTEDSL